MESRKIPSKYKQWGGEGGGEGTVSSPPTISSVKFPASFNLSAVLLSPMTTSASSQHYDTSLPVNANTLQDIIPRWKRLTRLHHGGLYSTHPSCLPLPECLRLPRLHTTLPGQLLTLTIFLIPMIAFLTPNTRYVNQLNPHTNPHTCFANLSTAHAQRL